VSDEEGDSYADSCTVEANRVDIDIGSSDYNSHKKELLLTEFQDHDPEKYIKLEAPQWPATSATMHQYEICWVHLDGTGKVHELICFIFLAIELNENSDGSDVCSQGCF